MPLWVRLLSCSTVHPNIVLQERLPADEVSDGQSSTAARTSSAGFSRFLVNVHGEHDPDLKQFHAKPLPQLALSQIPLLHSQYCPNLLRVLLHSDRAGKVRCN